MGLGPETFEMKRIQYSWKRRDKSLVVDDAQTWAVMTTSTNPTDEEALFIWTWPKHKTRSDIRLTPYNCNSNSFALLTDARYPTRRQGFLKACDDMMDLEMVTHMHGGRLSNGHAWVLEIYRGRDIHEELAMLCGYAQRGDISGRLITITGFAARYRHTGFANVGMPH
jgi:hypothetical protein